MEIVHVAILVIFLVYNIIVNHILCGDFFSYNIYRTTNVADIKLCLLDQQTDYQTIAGLEKCERCFQRLSQQRIFDNLFGEIFEFAEQETTMRVCFQNNNGQKYMPPITYTIIQGNNQNAVREIQTMPNRRISIDALDAFVHLFWHRIKNFVFKPNIVFNLTINVIISPTISIKSVVDQRYNKCCSRSINLVSNVSLASTSDQCFFINNHTI